MSMLTRDRVLYLFFSGLIKLAKLGVILLICNLIFSLLEFPFWLSLIASIFVFIII